MVQRWCNGSPIDIGKRQAVCPRGAEPPWATLCWNIAKIMQCWNLNCNRKINSYSTTISAWKLRQNGKKGRIDGWKQTPWWPAWKSIDARNLGDNVHLCIAKRKRIYIALDDAFDEIIKMLKQNETLFGKQA